MRPFAVLTLILGSLAALVFAFVSFSGSGDRGTRTTIGPVVKPADEPEEALPEINAPRSVVEQAKPLPDMLASQDRSTVDLGGPGTGAFAGFIDGMVMDPEGNPVENASVSLLDSPTGDSDLSDAIRLMNEEEPPKPRKKIVTDATGRFRFDALRPGLWSIVVTHDLFNREDASGIQVPETGGVEEIIQLTWGQGFYGYVTAAGSGIGIEGAVLTLDNPLAAFLPSTRRKASDRVEVRTDQTGYFAFKNSGGNNRTLLIKAEGYATQVHNNFGMTLAARTEPEKPDVYVRNMGKQLRDLAKQPKKPDEIDFELQEGMSIAGTVMGPDRSGVADVEIDAFFQAGQVGSMGRAVSKSNGEFLVEGLAEGLYSVRVTAPGYEATPLQRVEAGRTDVEIMLAEQGTVVGRVVEAASGRAVPRFTCRIRTLHPRNPTWGNVVAKGRFNDENGRFRLSGIPEGQYVAEGLTGSFASSFSEPFTVSQGMETNEIVVRLTKGGTIKGRVVDVYSGEPLAGAEVKTNDNNYVDTEFMELLGALSQTATTKREVRTDEDGAFEIELMTPDDYQIQISKAGYTTLILNNVKVGDGTVMELDTQSLSKGAVVRGVVFGPDDELVPGATVLLNPTDNGRLWGSKRARTDANGRFLLRNAEAGNYKINASRPQSVHGNPFGPVADMRNSELEITIDDGGEYDFELRIK